MEPFTTCLIFRVGAARCALPTKHVEEVLRPLPLQPVSATFPALLGVAVIRGEATPVIDAGRLLSDSEARSTRFISLKFGARRVALAVEQVIGTRALDPASLRATPPLLGQRNDSIESVTVLDRELLFVLRSVKLLESTAQLAAS